MAGNKTRSLKAAVTKNVVWYNHPSPPIRGRYRGGVKIAKPAGGHPASSVGQVPVRPYSFKN
jgi:hypothetical protein